MAQFRILELRNEHLRVRCAPELGGRIFSVQSERSEREWLWRRQERDLFLPSNPHDFSTGTFAGLDECCPTVGACAWTDGRMLHDHGNIWALPWDVGFFGKDRIDLSVEMKPLGLKFSRTVTLAENRVRFEYVLENVSAVIAPAMWSMHPLFSIHEEDQLVLHPLVDRLFVESVSSGRPSPFSTELGRPFVPYPEIECGVRLDRLQLADMEQGYIKGFVETGSAALATASLQNANTHDRLQVTWSFPSVPYLGLWLTRGGYRGWHHLAIEPCTAPFDKITDAAANIHSADSTTLAPGTQRVWWVQWTIA